MASEVGAQKGAVVAQTEEAVVVVAAGSRTAQSNRLHLTQRTATSK